MGSHQLRAQQSVTMQTCEYWLDYDFASRQSMAMDGSSQFQQQFDLSALPSGVHSIGLRFSDSKGRWCAPLVKHFVVPSLPAQTYDDNRIVGMEYWIDYDFGHRQAMACDNGTVALALDLSTLSPGVHSIAYRALDSRGIYLSPVLKHFVVPSHPEPTVTGMAAYEYWFNHGPRVHVSVEPQQQLTLNDVVIEIKDVVPNAIVPEYEFKVDELMVYCQDSVFFGIQAFDNVGHPTTAVLSDRFFQRVPVDPHFIALTPNDTTTFVTPLTGRIQGFRATAEVGDTISFSLSIGGHFDLYDAEGKAAAYKTEVNEETMCTTYTLEAASVTYFALLYDVPLVADSQQIVYTYSAASGITPSPTQRDTTFNVYTTAGILIRQNTQTLAGLPCGIYVVNGKKVVVGK